MILFLDDCPLRTKKFISAIPHAQTATTAQEMIQLIKNADEEIELVFLDHDLGGQTFVSSDVEDCGMQVVRYIEADRPKIDRIIVHSMNMPAAIQMKERLEHIGYQVEYIPFHLLPGKISLKS